MPKQDVLPKDPAEDATLSMMLEQATAQTPPPERQRKLTTVDGGRARPKRKRRTKEQAEPVEQAATAAKDDDALPPPQVKGEEPGEVEADASVGAPTLPVTDGQSAADAAVNSDQEAQAATTGKNEDEPPLPPNEKQAEQSDERAAVPKGRITLSMDDPVIEEARNYVLARSGPPWFMNMGKFGNDAFRLLLQLRRDEENNGKAFPPVEGALPQGRPMRQKG